MSNKRMTFIDFSERLRTDSYTGRVSAAKAIIKSKLDPEEKKAARLLVDDHFGVARGRGIEVALDQKQLHEEILKHKGGLSWRNLADQFHISSNTMSSFHLGRPVSPSTLKLIAQGLQQLTGLPNKLDGKKASKVIAAKPAIKARTTLIEVASVSPMLPSIEELDVRELEIIGRLREAHRVRTHQPAGRHLNGAPR